MICHHNKLLLFGDKVTPLTVASLGLMLFTVVSCVPEPLPSNFAKQEISTISTPTPNSDTPAARKLGDGDGAGNLTGTWLEGTLSSSCVFGMEQVGVVYGLVDITEDKHQLTEHRRPCSMTLSPILGMGPQMKPEVLKTTVEKTYGTGYVSSVAVGGAYASPTVVNLLGLKLTDPIKDSLPDVSAPTDPRVLDADNDGKPGITMQMSGGNCDFYTSQRQIFVHHGFFVTPNLIKGNRLNFVENRIFGATLSICNSQAPVKANDKHSAFAMARVDGKGGSINADKDGNGVISCDEVAPYFDELLKPREPVSDYCE